MMHRQPERITPSNVSRTNPNVHGLGLNADTPAPAPSPPKKGDLANGKMPSAAPVQGERRPLQDALRRVGSVDETLTVPTRSDSLKNRRSRRIRRVSLDNPFLEEENQERPESNQSELPFIPRDLDRFPHRGYTPQLPYRFDKSIDDRIPHDTTVLQLDMLQDNKRPAPLLSRPQFERSNTSYHTAQLSMSDYGEESSPSTSSHSKNTSVSMLPSLRSSPLRIHFDDRGHAVDHDFDSSLKITNAGSRPIFATNVPITSNQEWHTRRPSGNGTRFASMPALPTIPDSKDASPTSIKYPSWDRGKRDYDDLVNERDIPSNSELWSKYQQEKSALTILVEDLREELRAVSTELAASIQREMDLEDEVDRLKVELPISRDEPNRRTSDYYSDSAGSSVRFPLAESETRIQALEKMRRKAEQEKAQMRHSMAQKLQDDLMQRKTLELHCQTLEEQLNTRQNLDTRRDSISERTRELEVSLSDTKRRLNEERQIKQSVEDLLASLREDTETQRNERDNLRDEVVPQLRARLEGLELEAAETQKLAYENARMQQEIEALKTENQTLVNARKLQMDLQNSRSNHEADESMLPNSPPIGVSRSRSIMGSRSSRSKRFSMSNSNDLSESSALENPTDSLKDVEDQRDALQRTLKNLIYRQKFMRQQHARQISALELERNKAQSGSSRRKPFDVEVQELRNELVHLRRRADDAMEQKWQCEKGLSGLKMDLDRAQQETASLRDLLLDPDRSSQSPRKAVPMKSLDQAYADLRNAHTNFLEASRTQADRRPKPFSLAEERIGPLFSGIEAQLQANVELRNRLSEVVEHREQEQQATTRKITDLQSALKAAEDNVIAAQGASEDTLAQREELVHDLKEMKGQMSKRGIVHKDLSDPQRASTAQPIPQTPSLHTRSEKSPLVPQMGWKPTLARKSTCVVDQSGRGQLEKTVRDMEEEAGRAEREIKSIVERMNVAQAEVAALLAERDEAAKRTRRLQRDVLEERERVKARGVE